MKWLAIFLLLFTPAVAAQSAPSAPPPARPFSVQATALALTGRGQSVAAADTGAVYDFTKSGSIGVRVDAILAPANDVQGYFGGFNYSPSWLTPKTVEANGIRFYLTGGLGIDRIVPATGPSQQHIAALAGGGADYAPNGTFSVNLFEVRWGHLPGLDNNAVLVSSGLKLRF